MMRIYAFGSTAPMGIGVPDSRRKSEGIEKGFHCNSVLDPEFFKEK